MGFYIQDDFFESCDEIPSKQQDEVFGALVRYYFTGEEPDFKGATRATSKALFGLMRQRVDIAKAKAKAGSKSKSNANQNEIKTESNANQNSSSLAKSKSKSKKKEEPPNGGSKKAASRFTPPTATEVSVYAEQSGITLDAERFCDFYASKGWMVGKGPMRDWKAAARNWARRDQDEANPKGVVESERFREFADAL